MTHTTHWRLQPILFIGDVNVALFAFRSELVRRRVDWLPMGHSLNMIFLVQQSKTLPPLDNFHVVLESTSKLLDQLKNERFLKKVIWKYVIVKSNKP